MNSLFDSKISLKINITRNNNNIEDMLMKLFLLKEEDLEKREQAGLEYLENNHKWDKIISKTNMFYKELYET